MGIKGEADLSAIGRLIGEPPRARALMALSDGRQLPASMLAVEAGVAASTMSGHLARLVEGSMITVRQHGRYRYYQLAGPHIAELVEVLARVAPALTITSLREGTRAHAIRRARRCYDHMGGRIAVAITDSLRGHGYLDGHDGTADLAPGAYTLTPDGAAFLKEQGIALAAYSAVRCCVDWTEQRHHAGGTLGRELLAAFERRDWVKPAGAPRALTLTCQGHAAIEAAFDIDLTDPARSATP